MLIWCDFLNSRWERRINSGISDRKTIGAQQDEKKHDNLRERVPLGKINCGEPGDP
jgi:hypothetical protein